MTCPPESEVNGEEGRIKIINTILKKQFQFKTAVTYPQVTKQKKREFSKKISSCTKNQRIWWTSRSKQNWSKPFLYVQNNSIFAIKLVVKKLIQSRFVSLGYISVGTSVYLRCFYSLFRWLDAGERQIVACLCSVIDSVYSGCLVQYVRVAMAFILSLVRLYNSHSGISC